MIRAFLILISSVSLSFGQGLIVNPYVFRQTAPPEFSADALIYFFGTSGNILTTNDTVAVGLSGTFDYTESRTNLEHTFVTNNPVTWKFPIAVDGVLYSNFTHAIVFDMSVADPDRFLRYEGIFWRPEAITTNGASAKFTLRFENVSASADNDNFDVAGMNSGGDYIRGQFQTYTMVAKAHSEPGTSGVIPWNQGVWYDAHLHFADDSNMVSFALINTESGILVGAAEHPYSGQGELTGVLMQDYLWLGVNTGKIFYAAVVVELDPEDDKPIGQFIVSSPTNVLAESLTNSIVVNWSSTSGLTNQLQRSANGGSWTTLSSGVLMHYVDTNVFVGTNYQYRIATFYKGTSSEFGTSSVVSFTPDPSYVTGLIGRYKFNEGSGNLAYDSSGNNYRGIIAGSTHQTNTLHFSGTGSYVVAEVASSLTNYTFAMWVNPSSVSGFPHLIEGNPLQHLLFNGAWYPIWTDANSGYTVTTSVWTHLAVSYSPSGVVSYVNGVQVASSVTAATVISATLVIGANNASRGENFSGRMDDVQVFNRALDGAEIQLIFEEGRQ